MITPFEDKKTIKAILDTDTYIQRAGFKASNIKTTKYSTDTLNNQSPEFQIFISQGTPENPNNWIQKGIVYNISVVGRRSNSNTVDNVVSQVIALLTEVDIGRAHILYLLDPPMELESDPAVYIVETAFVCYETIFNKVKS